MNAQLSKDGKIHSLHMVTYSAVGSKLLLGGGLNQQGFGGMLPPKNFALEMHFPCFLGGIFIKVVNFAMHFITF
jgi:hypothetical protein